MDKLNLEIIIEDILNFGAKYAKTFNTEELEFSNKFREYCEENRCGNYGTNWMCPPGVGDIEKLKLEVMRFGKGIVYQTVYPVKNIKDRNETDKIRDMHNDFTRRLNEHLRDKYKISNILPMGAGPCKICPSCAYLKEEKCYFPQKAISSAEAYGINLGTLLTSCGLKFNYSDDSLAYVGIFLL
ncbi:MAG: DUF2284 domain-containing protein [Clostridiaceae bacterium]